MSAPVKKVPIHLQSAQTRLLIKNGKVVNEDGISEDDIYIEDGIIKQMGKNLIIPGGTRTIDARGRYVMPGGIDPHTHLDTDFLGTRTVDDFYQGTKAAIAGGTTMILDFVVPKKDESLLDAYYEWRHRADGKVCCDYSFHIAVTSWSQNHKKEMEILCKENGINSFKVFMAYDFALNDTELYETFEACKSFGAIAQVHAENGAVIAKNVEKLLSQGVTGPEGHALSRPEEVEAEAVNRACMIAKQADCPLYVVHVMSKSATLALKKQRENGCHVYGETLACALVKDGLIYKSGNYEQSAGHVLCPPLSSDSTTPHALMEFLANDTLQVVGSDHFVFNKSQKELGKHDFSKIPYGVNGLEDRMSVVWQKGVQDGVMDPCRFVAVTSTNAAKIFNLFPRKGYIGVGSDADLVIWNADKVRVISAKTHHHAVDFNVFENMECHGVCDYVILNGRVCVDDGQLRVVEGFGRFIETPVYAPYLYDKQKFTELKPVRNGTSHDDSHQNDLYECKRKLHLETVEICTPTLPDSMVNTPSCRAARPEGQRNIQDTTFSISEDLDVERKCCIRVKNPPGGKSSGFW